MNLAGQIVVVTGAAGGIGRELVLQLAEAGARVAASDFHPLACDELARQLGPGHLSAACDVADGAAFAGFLAQTAHRLGPIDIFIGNAGVAVGGDPVATPDTVWDQALDVNLRQHVTAARELLPTWLRRRRGYFVVVASAAGLLTQIGSAPYAVSKHAAVAFAEWLAVTYGDRGVGVSCVCPMGVDTRMLQPGSSGALEPLGARVVRSAGDVLAPVEVAESILEGIRDERFLITPHPEVVGFFQRKAGDYERWLAGMRRLQTQAGLS
jgi:NAD(P)-dependent dehydrogenase (short-subunit alcohol dehydrogenase family)